MQSIHDAIQCLPHHNAGIHSLVMNESQKETYIAWLNDAHAMEEGLITILEKQIEETKDRPEMQEQLKVHLEETRGHAQKVRACVESHGESVSGGKDYLSKATATLNGLGMSMMSDAMVKNVHSSYAAEHFEIATYTLIQAAAAELGDTAAVDMCEEILDDEIRMAEWLLTQIPVVVADHISEQA